VVVVEEEKAGSMDYYIYEELEKFLSVFGGYFKYINNVSSERECALFVMWNVPLAPTGLFPLGYCADSLCKCDHSSLGKSHYKWSLYFL
jgi:hypothetical protein